MRWLKRGIHDFLRGRGYVLLKREYMPLGIDLAADIARTESIRDFRTIFDVGANVGHMSLLFAREFPAADIHAFEPVGATFHALRVTATAWPRISCHQLAMGERPGTVEVFLQEDSGLNSLHPSNNHPDTRTGGTSEVVTVATVDDFCRLHHIEAIDLLKTDAEGLDLSILKGADDMIRRGRIRCILSECGFNPDNTRNTPFSHLASFLFERGYKVKAFYDQSDFGRRPYMTCANALFMLQKPAGTGA